MFTAYAAWQKTFIFRMVIAFLLEITDGIHKSTYIFWRGNFAPLTF